jgi:hypothetical protein
MPLVCPGWLSCSLLFSAASASCHTTASRSVAPTLVHLLFCSSLSSCPSSSLRLPLACPGWLSCHLSSRCRLPSACASASHHVPFMPFVRLIIASPIHCSQAQQEGKLLQVLWQSCRGANQQHAGNLHDKNCHPESSYGGCCPTLRWTIWVRKRKGKGGVKRGSVRASAESRAARFIRPTVIGHGFMAGNIAR